jgi:hypothetical protein
MAWQLSPEMWNNGSAAISQVSFGGAPVAAVLKAIDWIQ